MASRLKKRTLRWLIPIHRWLGLFLSLILLLWFISGIVMMFEGYPRTSDAERMEWLSSVSLDKVSVTPGEALSEATREAAGPVRMNQPGDRPLIHLKTSDGDWRSLYADSGQPIAPLDEESAATRAESITGYPAEEAQRLSRPDQWTVSGRFDAHLPLWRVTLDDERRRWVYLSENTGEMIHETSRRERLWGYAGAVIHWIYPTQLRELSGFWRQLVMWLAGLGTLACLSGLILGILVLRRRRTGWSPYRGWFLWHHYLGLLFGVLASTWAFSGLLSLDPFRWAASDRPEVSVQDSFGSRPNSSHSSAPLWETLPGNGSGDPPWRELQIWQFADTPWYRALDTEGDPQLLHPDNGREQTALSEQQIHEAARALPGHSLEAITRLTGYDNYYYAGRAERVRDLSPPLPVYRADYTDGLRLYINPADGQVIQLSTPRNRVNRWLYNGLHSLDFPALAPGSFPWYVLVVALMTGGTLASGTGVWLTLRYLRRKLKP